MSYRTHNYGLSSSESGLTKCAVAMLILQFMIEATLTGVRLSIIQKKIM